MPDLRLGCCCTRVPWPVLHEWQGETPLRFKLRGLPEPPYAKCWTPDAHQTHAAVDLGCNESAQLMYKVLLRVVAGYRPLPGS